MNKPHFEIAPEQRRKIMEAADRKLRTLPLGKGLRLLRHLAGWACYHDSRLMYWSHGYETAFMAGRCRELETLLK